MVLYQRGNNMRDCTFSTRDVEQQSLWKRRR
jgi:hypothetical protein